MNAAESPQQSSRRVPSLSCHKASGRAYVRLNGRCTYVGKFGTPESLQQYHRVIAEWMASGCTRKDDAENLTVLELVDRYRLHVEEYYVKPDGTSAVEQQHFRQVLRMMNDLYGMTAAAEFGPLALKAIRQNMLERQWCRRYINQQSMRIKRVFRWAAENELVPGSVYHALQAVAGLKEGRSKARESRPIKPVKEKLISAVQPFVSSQVWAMIQTQLLTGARGGELCVMRPCDINRSGRVWLYEPSAHKGAWRGHHRQIYIGPRAQKVLMPYLLRDEQAFCFSPADAEKARRDAITAARTTPLTYGNRPGTNRRRKPRKAPGNRYTSCSYARAISNAMKRAFPVPAELARHEGETFVQYKARLSEEEKAKIKAWHKEHHWHPHQLRHNAGTEIRKEFGPGQDHP